MSATDRKPDHSAFNRFRNALVKARLRESVFEEINRQLSKHQLLMKLLSRRQLVREENRVLAEDRIKNERPQEVGKKTISVNLDAARHVKATRAYFGFKMFSSVNGRGFIKYLLFTSRL